MKQILSTITALLVMVMIGHSQANRRLSNLLSPTAVNTHLLPISSGTIDLGSDAYRWRNGYFNGSVTAYGVGSSYGVYGTGTSYGVRGIGGSYGVYGSGTSYGLYGLGGTYGVYGSGTSYGVRGISTDGYGVYGSSTSDYGVRGVSSSSYGVYGSSTSNYGVTGSSTNSYGVRGAGGSRGVYGTGTSYGVVGEGGTYGVYGSGTSYGVRGISTDGYGVYGSSTSDYGVRGVSSSSYGVYGSSSSNIAGRFISTSFHGIWATESSSADNVYAGVFESRVYSYGGYAESSDRNLKKNIKDIGNAMSIINQLKPKNYEFRDDGNLAALHLPKGIHYGLIAQELELVLPDLVADGPAASNISAEPLETVSGDGKAPANTQEGQIAKPAPTEKRDLSFKGIYYDELIPLLIKGMQEQQAQIDELKSQLASLKGNKASDAADLTGVWLKQNSPNPFRENTTVQFALPASVKDAQLLVYDQGGRLVRSVSLSSGQNQVSFAKGSLPSGNYVYSLMVNGKKVDSKNMIIAK